MDTISIKVALIKKAGTYEVNLIAVDVNGNKTEKSFKVNVKERNSKETIFKQFWKWKLI